MRRGIVTLVLLALALVALGVGGIPSAEAARVLVFNSTRWVDAGQCPSPAPSPCPQPPYYGDGSQESENVQGALAALGHTVTPIAGAYDGTGACGPYFQPGTVLASADAYSTALANTDAFLIPEQESWCNLPGEIPADVAAVWRAYVGGGGTLIIHSSDVAFSKVAALLQVLFEFAIGGVNGTGVTATKTAAAAGTHFAGGPATLPGNAGTGMIPVSSLPAGAISLYESGANAAVTLMRYGAGKVIVLGWDWTHSTPPWPTGQDGGWMVILDAAVAEAIAPVTPVSRMLVTGPATGSGPQVRVFTDAAGALSASAMAYDASFQGGVFVAVGHVTGTGDAQVVTGAGAGGGPHVRVLNKDGSDAGVSFFAYAPSFGGGVRVAACDVDGDGKDEIITAPGPGGGPHVRVWKVTGGVPTELVGFYAYAPTVSSGVYVACGDLDGDGRAEVVTGADAGGGPHVRAWHVGSGGVSEMLGFFAYAPSFTGGVRVAVADVDGDGRAEIITGAGPGGGPHVRVWSVTGSQPSELLGFFAYDPGFSSGVYVAGGQMDDQPGAEIVTGAGAGGGPHVRVFTSSLQELGSFFAYDAAFTGGVTVAVGR